MPLDATNFSETIPAPLTLDDLIAWLRTKPADETYCYTSPGRCLISQYLIERGLAREPSIGPVSWWDLTTKDGYRRRPLPCSWNVIAAGCPSRGAEKRDLWRFGAALDRALTYAATGKV